MARVRPTEVKLVSELLEHEAESVEALSKAVIEALDRDRAKRETFVIRIRIGPDTFGMGPFVTRNAAIKTARAMHPEAPDEVIEGCVARLMPPLMLDTEEVAPKVGNYCPTCSHPMVAHDWPKAKIRGCVVAGCPCGNKATEVAA